ncbi:MAG: hypothetical protein MUF73_00020 [Rhodobacteraceae bacterium]|jgi:hypothetical protein|nr:hypothetical protein [Paracoccaceae bacterium]
MPRRVVHADVAALDQMLVYNRFGSFNPFGMIFALRRDLSPADLPPAFGTVAEQVEVCAGRTGAEPGAMWDDVTPGNARLKDCKRPRPMVLRVNAGDVLHVRLTNLLWGDTAPATAPGLSESFCRGAGRTDTNTTAIRALVAEGPAGGVAGEMGLAVCDAGTAAQAPALVTEAPTFDLTSGADWPLTRGVNLVFQGLTPVAADGTEGGLGLPPACLGLGAIGPGDAPVDCYWRADQEGTYFGTSTAAAGGGEGGGGSLVHGLFAAVVVEPAGSQWFRSQVTQTAFDAAWAPSPDAAPHVRSDSLDYQAMEGDAPILNILRDVAPGPDGGWSPTGVPYSGSAAHVEIVHTDLNAVIHGPMGAFREFSVFFHDELKTFYTRNFDELAMFGQLAGVRDGFAINYGASGMGTLLLANRKGIGPAADCVECLYEEFFLASWANGDPALLEGFPDDPSNVHHSYLNDPVVFRNFHAGPKETHVFHLHAHQWFGGNDPGRGSYLDSQTVAPQQGFTYRIFEGGQPDPATLPAGAVAGELGWWEEVGSGNRNRTPGDSIFHCHLYPHFAQGMWALWRVHDALEDGTRRLPDGQATPGFSTDIRPSAERAIVRAGSVTSDGAFDPAAEGTPVPGLLPLPEHALPVIPTYTGETYGAGTPAQETATAETAFPGYPFYVAGQPGHRPPQAPLDIVHVDGAPTGGIGRHVVTGGTRSGDTEVSAAELADPARVRELELHLTQGVARLLALGDMTAEFETLEIRDIPHEGTALERTAMAVHHDGQGATTVDATGTPRDPGMGVYAVPRAPGPTATALTSGGFFAVNGAPPAPGAPFADPCAAHPVVADGAAGIDPLTGRPDFIADPRLTGFRRYEGSAVQVGLVTNRAGWHDPQGRINVLTADSDRYKEGNGLVSPRVSAEEQPFFFRAFSGECIEFRHTNELPKELELDDFQVRTPTDTIGQHIHLVKFDVMAADGSGNGFNYEDGTFAADELVARRCIGRGEVCDLKDQKVWQLPLSENRMLFQTTIQRWYADPILSASRPSIPDPGAPGGIRPPGEPADRTLRTVFTHDHFGPSSIQQHGFYSALLIEPSDATVCAEDGTTCMQPPARTLATIETQGDAFRAGVGARVLVSDMFGDHLPEENALANYREFALAVADFATLYDPRDRASAADACAAVNLGEVTETRPAHCAGEVGGTVRTSLMGMEKIACEAWFMASPHWLREMCGSDFSGREAADFAAQGWWSDAGVPAWVARGFPGLRAARTALGAAPAQGLITHAEAARLFDHMIAYRRMAAGNPPDRGELARPVAPPDRPESISVDHHDPYLVNYRGEPAPLRLGLGSATDDCAPRPLADWAADLGRDGLAADQTADIGRCSIDRQAPGAQGDPANLFRTAEHGADAVTPILESYSGEKLMIRLIQGAQEVQHSFTVEGRQWLRNTDQAFGAIDHPPERSPERLAAPTLRDACLRAPAARGVNPLFHEAWRVLGPRPPAGDPRAAFFAADLGTYLGADDALIAAYELWAADYEALAAGCENLEGMVTAQEIGISEHFEFKSAFRFEIGGAERARLPEADDPVPFLTYGDTGAGETGAGEMGAGGMGSRDTIYHFGSLDALWNGAWGILRVHSGPDAPDVTCAADSPPHPDCRAPVPVGAAVGDRLPLLPVPGLTAAGGTEGGLADAGDLRIAGQMPCGPDAPVVRATVAAVSARTAFGGPLRHGGGISDPDGLFLTLVDPLPPGAEPRRTVTRAERDGMLARIRAIHGAQGERLQPLVLPVAAGSCLDLTVVNLLDPVQPDGIGDAPMPPIVPLNVGAGHAPDGDAAFDMRLAAAAGSDRMTGVRPSAQVSLQLGLPRLDAPEVANAPFGRNPTGALAPGELERSRYYAGRLSLPNPRRAPEGLADAPLQDRLDWMATHARWMPYAWGPLPVRAYGDIFAHGLHGMVGTVLVLPQGYVQEQGGPVLSGGALAPATSAVGHGVLYAVDASDLPLAPDARGERRMRSFVLHWRDGLNLRDADSDLRWRDQDGALLAGLRLVPDCAVCDDSYDLGDAALDYLSPQAAALLRDQRGTPVEANFDFNAIAFPEAYWRDAAAGGRVPVLRAVEGEEIVVHVVHPGGRARQRAFVTFGQGYDDLFPGFGFPHAALLAPGKAVTASLSRPARAGCYLFGDGPVQLRSNGVWGVLDVARADGTPSCGF